MDKGHNRSNCVAYRYPLPTIRWCLDALQLVACEPVAENKDGGVLMQFTQEQFARPEQRP
jgi:hypothetical protein